MARPYYWCAELRAPAPRDPDRALFHLALWPPAEGKVVLGLGDFLVGLPLCLRYIEDDETVMEPRPNPRSAKRGTCFAWGPSRNLLQRPDARRHRAFVVSHAHQTIVACLTLPLNRVRR